VAKVTNSSVLFAVNDRLVVAEWTLPIQFHKCAAGET
jgi:hypothetical protein